MSKLTRRTALRLAAAGAMLPVAPMLARAAGHGGKHTVTIKNFTFEPSDLTIAKGETVTFLNTDGAPHTATADNGTFDTGRLGKGDKKAFKFTAAGTFTYFCALHPKMKGTITVS